MKAILNRLRKIGKRLKKSRKKFIRGSFFAKKRYIRYVKKKSVNPTYVLLESQQGKALGSNILAIAMELSTAGEYKQMRIFLTVTADARESILKKLKNTGLYDRLIPVTLNTSAYYRILATAGYLINDNTFVYPFIKREEQVYLNTWHGTPLKTLGKAIKSETFTIGNAQKNLLSADYLLFPNTFTRDKMLSDYMLNHFATGQVLLTGYPRNEIFFSEEARSAVREKYGFVNQRVIAYLPTWRGTVGKVGAEEQNRLLSGYLSELDALLSEDERVYVKLHPISRGAVDIGKLSHIFPFPEEEDVYTFLNATDVLVTDYSSVMFDYAVTRRKIVLFAYDEETYEAERGFYFPLAKLPFPKTGEVAALYEELCKPKEYDDTEFLKEFCTYDGKGVTKTLCARVFSGKKDLLAAEEIPYDGKKNIVIYAGGFLRNGITTSILNLSKYLDYERYHYRLLYKTDKTKKNHPALAELPKEMELLGFTYARSSDLWETILTKLWSKLHVLPYRFVRGIYEKIAKRDIQRIFGKARIDAAVQFSGYAEDMVMLFQMLPCKRMIFIHNDMREEAKLGRCVRLEMLSEAYTAYDTVAPVTTDLLLPTKLLMQECKQPERDFTVIKNVIDYRKITEKAQLPLTIDASTAMNVTEEALNEILESDAVKFINIGRFSPEKGQLRLIAAFDKIYETHPEAYLIIIGSHGVSYEKILEAATKQKSREHIVIIRYLSNPFPVLCRCSYFVLSSFYEGFGLVLCEADILKIPCFSTDITGPRDFLREHGGHLVMNSEEGIYEGMKDCLLGKNSSLLQIDYEEYNQSSAKVFESSF